MKYSVGEHFTIAFDCLKEHKQISRDATTRSSHSFQQEGGKY